MKKKRFQHSICFSSVEDMQEAKGSVAFITDSAKVFKDDIDITPQTLTDGTQYVPWGGDNMMPYNILSMIEKDETLATCQMFNAEDIYSLQNYPKHGNKSYQSRFRSQVSDCFNPRIS